MSRSALARAYGPEEENVSSPSMPQPFALRFAERVGPRPVLKSSDGEIFDDPTTVDWTSQQRPEDPHTDEA